jgi:hypothetical protein
MHDTGLTKAIQDIKSRAVARRRVRQPVSAPAVLARIELLERIAEQIARTLQDVIEALPGLTLVRSFGCGSRVLAASGAEPPRREGRRTRAAWSRLEFRLRVGEGGATLVLGSCATACDADLPSLRTELPVSDDEPTAERAREFVEECALVFARALLRRRAHPGERLDAGRRLRSL